MDLRIKVGVYDTAHVGLLFTVSSINQLSPEDPLDPLTNITGHLSAGGPLGLRPAPVDEEPTRVCVCLVKPTPGLLNLPSSGSV